MQTDRAGRRQTLAKCLVLNGNHRPDNSFAEPTAFNFPSLTQNISRPAASTLITVGDIPQFIPLHATCAHLKERCPLNALHLPNGFLEGFMHRPGRSKAISKRQCVNGKEATMGTLIKLDCDPALENHSRCIFYGTLIASDQAWAVYIRDDDEIIVLYDKAMRAVHILDDTRELRAFLNGHSHRRVTRAMSRRGDKLYEGFDESWRTKRGREVLR